MSATATDWKTSPLPEERRYVALDRVFDQAEMDRIRNGLIPEEMEVKWFLYFDDGTLYMHRSWTGFCVYEVRFIDNGHSGSRMIEALVNCNPEQYQSNDPDEEPRKIGALIDRLLLRRNTSLPHSGKTDVQAAISDWAEIGRASIGIMPADKD